MLPDVSSAPSRVLIVDDHRAFADLLADALDAEADFSVVGTAATADDAVRLAAEHEVNLVLMDIRLGSQDGLIAAQRIRTMLPDVVVVIVSAYADADSVSRAASVGAAAFAPKTGSLSEMLSTLRHARDGSMVLTPSLLRDAASMLPAGPQPAALLTDREREVLALMGDGCAPSEIARSLGLSVHTARGHVKSIHTKLDARSQLQAVVKALRLGLLDNRP